MENRVQSSNKQHTSFRFSFHVLSVMPTTHTFPFTSLNSRAFACWNTGRNQFSVVLQGLLEDYLSSKGEGALQSCPPPHLSCSTCLCVPAEWLLSVKGCQSMPRAHIPSATSAPVFLCWSICFEDRDRSSVLSRVLRTQDHLCSHSSWFEHLGQIMLAC